MRRKTIAEHMADILTEQSILLESKIACVGYGDLDQIHECAERAGMYKEKEGKSKFSTHPLNIIHKVLAGLERSTRFKKGFYMLCVGKGGCEREARCFTLQEGSDGT